MHGVKVAAAITGASLLATAAIFFLIVGLVTWLGFWGGALALAIVVAAMFATIAWAENRS